MERYFDLVGDEMPDKDQIHLPCWKNQEDIYCRYCTDQEITKKKSWESACSTKSGERVFQMWLFLR